MNALFACMPAWQKRASDPNIDGYYIIWVLGVELKTSGGATSTLNHCVISLALFSILLKITLKKKNRYDSACL